MDELKAVEFGDAGGLPDAVRSRVRRRRAVRRVRGLAGSAAVLALCAVVGVFVIGPGDHGAGVHGRSDGAVISLDDPMFDALDQGRGMGRVDTRWRAGARLDGDWVWEM
ncbi:MAG: hypothetical protein CMJ35_06750 [Phycisphaerae bacterium]|nr:hypothetical protein [Phycisphaerae bacterium]MBM91298.1 hypothetical protein [Phycisphaerae bacterium]